MKRPSRRNLFGAAATFGLLLAAATSNAKGPTFRTVDDDCYGIAYWTEGGPHLEVTLPGGSGYNLNEWAPDYGVFIRAAALDHDYPGIVYLVFAFHTSGICWFESCSAIDASSDPRALLESTAWIDFAIECVESLP